MPCGIMNNLIITSQCSLNISPPPHSIPELVPYSPSKLLRRVYNFSLPAALKDAVKDTWYLLALKFPPSHPHPHVHANESVGKLLLMES